MKPLILLLSLGLTSFASYGQPRPDHVNNARFWILRLQEKPAQAAVEIGEAWFVVGRDRTQDGSFAAELLALDLVAYYAELEVALTEGTERPFHEDADLHDRFFRERVRPRSYREFYEEFDLRADHFAVALFKNLADRDAETDRQTPAGKVPPPHVAPLLIQSLLGGKRRFWFDRIMRQVISRVSPVKADLRRYARALPEYGDLAFLSAFAQLRWDLKKEHAQAVIDDFVGMRTAFLKHVPFTGDAECDRMLSHSLKGVGRSLE